VADARKQAERSSPPVRAAALMRVARVQSAVDPGQARITFEMALDEIRSLPSPDRDLLFEQAQQIAAAFDYVIRCDAPFSFPFGYAVNLMHKLDDQRRLNVLRRAMDAWRAPQDAELMRTHGIPQGDGHSGFIRLLQWQG